MQNKKAQGAFEFMILTSFLVLAITIFFLVVNEKTQDRLEEKRNLEMKQIIELIQNEINLASQSTDGYSREFKVPVNILGNDYTIQVGDDILTITSFDGKFATALPLPKIIGAPIKGINKIEKTNGTIILNG